MRLHLAAHPSSPLLGRYPPPPPRKGIAVSSSYREIRKIDFQSDFASFFAGKSMVKHEA